MNNVIVSIDGNVNTGKTSLFESLKSRYPLCFYSEEYANIAIKDDLERQLMYLRQDEKRTIRQNSDIILDRSVISLFAYVYWLYKSGKNDIRCNFFNYVVNGAADRKFMLPNRIIYCYQDFNIILKTFKNNHKIKGTETLFATKMYCKIQDVFYSRLIDKLDGKVIKYNYLSDNHKLDIYNEKNSIENYSLIDAIRSALEISNIDCKISINGSSAVGKSSLCINLTKSGYKVMSEVNFVNVSNNESDELIHQVLFYRESLERYLGSGKIVIDNGIFETISYTFFLASHKKYGMEFIERYFKLIMDIYQQITINQIFYLYISDDELIERKRGDLLKVREHFEGNISFRSSELKFAVLLSKILPDNLFIIMEAGQTKDNIYKKCVGLINYCVISVRDFIRLIYKNRREIYNFYAEESI